MAHTVIGFFQNESEAQDAIQRLEQVGISRDQIDLSRGTGSVESSGITGTSTSTSSNVESYGNNSGSYGNNTEKENGITRFFKSLFGDNDDDAERYATIGSRGYSIVTVHAQTGSDAERAADVLDDAGAVDVDETLAQYSDTGSDRDISLNSGSNIRQTTGTESMQTMSNEGDRDADVTIPKVQEELQVGKRTVERGGVRVRSRIVEKPLEESIRLREEHVRVDRQDVNRPVRDTDRAAFQDHDIELTETSEVPVVNKEARVVEEVKISKDVSERNETIRDTVRNTEVDIDEVNSDNLSDDASMNRKRNIDTDYDTDLDSEGRVR